MSRIFRAASIVLAMLAIACRSQTPQAKPPPPAAAHAPPASSVHDEVLPEECGELVLERRALEVDGKGERHPRVIAIEDALAKCADRSPSAVACQSALREGVRNHERGYGPRHPAMLVANAKLELCRATFGPAGVPPSPPPGPEDCANLRTERDALIREGKAERHPQRMAVEARLAECD